MLCIYLSLLACRLVEDILVGFLIKCSSAAHLHHKELQVSESCCWAVQGDSSSLTDPAVVEQLVDSKCSMNVGRNVYSGV
jgi:hypothetical protein